MSEPRPDLDLPIFRDLGDSLKAGFRRREAHDVGRALRRRRMLLVGPVAALVAAGGAFAAVSALKGTPSAPLTGPVAAPSPSPGWGTTRYSVTTSPSLQAGTVGWCIDAEVQVPVPVAVDDVPLLRSFLHAQRTQLTAFRIAAIENLHGQTATLTMHGQSITLPPPTPARRPSLEQGLRTTERHLREIPALLADLNHPRARATLSFQNAIRQLAGSGYNYKAPGQDCGHVATASSSFVGRPYIGFTGSEYSIPNVGPATPFGPGNPAHALGSTTLTTTAVYLTASNVAAVQTAPGHIVLTKRAALPNGYRIAVTVKATVEHPKTGRVPLESNRIYSAQQPPTHSANGTLPSTSKLPVPIALNHHGQPIAAISPPPSASMPSIAWKPEQQFVPKYANGGDVRQLKPGTHPPPGACEIDTTAIPTAHAFWGAVVPHLQAFPHLTGTTLMSCAYLSFYLPNGAAPQAAVLLDAQHPNAAPPPLPGAHPINGNNNLVNEHITQLSGTTNLTARRTDNAWLAIEGAGTLTTQIKILNRLQICVHITNTPCHATTTIPNLNHTTPTTTNP